MGHYLQDPEFRTSNPIPGSGIAPKYEGNKLVQTQKDNTLQGK